MRDEYNIIILSDKFSGSIIQNLLDRKKCKTIVNVESISDSIFSDPAFHYVIVWGTHAAMLSNVLIQSGVESTKIINLTDYMYEWQKRLFSIYQINPDFMNVYTAMQKVKSNPTYELFITGLSYPYCGINPELLQKKSVKLTLPSQDLYYDYLIAKQLLSNPHVFQYCIMGIGYFSFHFDLSLSSEAHRIHNVYYPLFQDGHHTPVATPLSTHGLLQLDTSEFLSSIFIMNFEYACIEKLGCSAPELSWLHAEWNTAPFHMSVEEHGKIRAQSHSKIFYPNTLIENKMIFKKYLDLLMQYNIKPIVVVFPVTSYYARSLNPKLKEGFYNVINEFRNMYSFQVLDLFDSSLFEDSDFYDSDHMNKKGADKMSVLLNQIINW
ncbi:hypothetical protein [Bacillus gaemokensis]|uniref:Uncharacterized protein n=1 Tax=Bacillus gaemokensis TaxID=574375 RepID=A0A073KCD8_9BACI|nr:hypothetical protein [Bacillus gaemokensis]KEK24132.1 hypothetical protein BAGA_29200 [Bacillus gaemokensis]KYG32725.1 hypothetical protein AZF08_11590 [Bacillus gaemokensis]